MILASAGTDGDVFPFVALGLRLRERGHRVTLAANEQYQNLAAGHGCDFCTLVTDAETRSILANPEFWDQSSCWRMIKNTRIAAGWAVKFLQRQYELIAELAKDKHSVLVASPGVFAARLVQERMCRPLVTVYYTPWMIPSSIAPPVMPGGFTLPPWAPRFVGNLYWRAIDFTGGMLMGGPLNQLRSSLGLKPVRRIFQWWLSPNLAIGLFPAWYANPQADWPPQLRVSGFPLYDGPLENKVPQEVLEFCDAADPPVAFTFGTGMMFADRLFREAMEACRLLDIRAVFVTKHERHLPTPLPPFIQHCRFAPFRQLFRHCGAVVHHGGIGTTAKALAAGTPQLVLPIAWDQPDNSVRVKRLGAGDCQKSTDATAQHIAKLLTKLMAPDSQQRCQAIAEQFGKDDSLDIAAKWIEGLCAQDGE